VGFGHPTNAGAGIDPASRLELVTDHVRLAARIERLTEREEDAELGNIATSRAVNVATAERRRLHARLFEGAREVEPGPTAAEIKKREGYIAWVDFFSERTGTGRAPSWRPI
jgi:hypothetical protein